ncbi:MAG: hypothetical protein D6742_13470, partial [Cyanobacteria bacterium J069]
GVAREKSSRIYKTRFNCVSPVVEELLLFSEWKVCQANLRGGVTEADAARVVNAIVLAVDGESVLCI